MGYCASWWIHGFRILVRRVHSNTSPQILMWGYNCYRTLQFIVSPKIGALSDKYGRKRILLLTMIGNILSAVVYECFSFSTCVGLTNVLVGGFSPLVLDLICFPE